MYASWVCWKFTWLCRDLASQIRFDLIKVKAFSHYSFTTLKNSVRAPTVLGPWAGAPVSPSYSPGLAIYPYCFDTFFTVCFFVLTLMPSLGSREMVWKSTYQNCQFDNSIHSVHLAGPAITFPLCRFFLISFFALFNDKSLVYYSFRYSFTITRYTLFFFFNQGAVNAVEWLIPDI